MVDVVLMQGFVGFMWLLSMALILFSGFALIDAATRREDAYRAADKQTKPFWLIILGLAFVVNLIFNILSFLPIIGLIATIVYMVDVRPALRGLPGGGRARRGSSSDGPYGPYNGGR
ncbi:membrane protein [Streptomyces spinoverrucosus]|uniref:Membrane protein n=2 Tax=Streptomyces TaxID=1883 RepID=A0A4Y3VQ59_9ACTN|nr:membrane protein [Streptomyces spinoverrucosus]GGT44811.1 membrane protein [Streptomyces chromofuscus]GHB52936.1 membrane protein [Streptomyces spinoverrucosus]